MLIGISDRTSLKLIQYIRYSLYEASQKMLHFTIHIVTIPNILCIHLFITLTYIQVWNKYDLGDINTIIICRYYLIHKIHRHNIE